MFKSYSSEAQTSHASAVRLKFKPECLDKDWKNLQGEKFFVYKKKEKIWQHNEQGCIWANIKVSESKMVIQ